MKSKSFRYLWLGQLLANFGDVFYIVGCISILYGFTSSAFYLGLLPFLNTIDRFISSLLSPILFNKYRLKTLLVGSQTGKTIFLFGLSCFVSFQKEQGIWLVLFLIFLIAFFDGWALPATNAMLPRLVKKEELVKANSFVAVMNQTTQLSGWALGSMLVAFLTGKNVIWLTFVLFVFSTIMMKGIVDNTPFQPAENREKKSEAMKEGWLIIWNNVVWVAAILYVFVKEIFHVSEAWWGYMNTIYFIGLIVGGLFCTKVSPFIEGRLQLILICTSIGAAVITFLFGLNTYVWLALLLVALSGIIDQMKDLSMTVYIQKEATVDELPKIYGVQQTIISLFFGLSTLVFGAIAEWNVQFAFYLAGGLLALSSVYLIFSRSRLNKGYLDVS
ncbi:MFS transporter [Caldifermentibacillus hisashii]|uniref:MFS transporter n=1 Tax=Caldifermentibacillus hisashii TaxID=996558 RepID=UPI0031017FC8